jgi:hypothetical protein
MSYSIQWSGVTIMKKKPGDIKSIVTYLEDLRGDFYEDHTKEILTYIDNESAEVRKAAILGLWDADLNEALGPLLDTAEKDADPDVQASALSVLGRYIYEGEFLKDDGYSIEDDVLDSKTIEKVRKYLMDTLYDESQPEIKRKSALESLAFDPGDKEEEIINDWYKSKSINLKASSIFSMGRSGLMKWEKPILKALQDKDKIVRREAIRAVGESCIEDGVKHLELFIEGDDRELALEAIAAIGKIGGDEAIDVLYPLTESDDEEIAESAEEAMEEAEDLVDYYEEDNEENIKEEESDEFDEFEDYDEDLEDDEGDHKKKKRN